MGLGNFAMVCRNLNYDLGKKDGLVIESLFVLIWTYLSWSLLESCAM